MSKDIPDDHKKLLLKIARENIKAFLENKEYSLPDYPKEFDEYLGVFVTLNKLGNLRGCIGYPEPVKPLIDALVDVSIHAAVEDPRFNPVTTDELDDITIEISVLTKPEEVIVDDPLEYPDMITVGLDGLIIENGYNRGLLLPQVPVEWNWSIIEYLENLCNKANLNKDAWKNPQTRIYSFQANVFTE